MLTITIVMNEDKIMVVHPQDAPKKDIVSMLQHALGEAIVDLYNND